MGEIRTANYEAMFLLSQAQAADFRGAIDHINELLAKAGATVIAMKKWDERRLAYEIRKQKRGVFILCYFSSRTDTVHILERDCNLSERILRTLIIRCDHLTEEEMRSADARQELEVEARLRAEQAASRPEGGPMVSVGAPPRGEPEVMMGEDDDTGEV